jgi:hypothetical protein
MKKQKNKKYTLEQIDAMNRQLFLVNSEYYYVLFEGRLCKEKRQYWEIPKIQEKEFLYENLGSTSVC